MREKRILEKLVNILLDLFIGIFSVILIVTIYNAIQTKVFDNDYSSLFGYTTFEVQSGSMSNEINKGDWIIVKYSDNIQLNDIITFKKDDNFVTHRVVEEYNNTFVTKGDANNTKDDPISKDQVVGKVVKILPNFGVIKKTLLNPIVLVAIIVTLYLLGYVFRNVKKDQTNNIKEKIDAVITKLLNKIIPSNKKNTEPMKKNVLEVIEERTLTSESKEEQSNEVIEDDSNQENEDEDFTVELPEMDMEKTIYFRMISVNKDDVDGAYDKKNTKKSDIIIEDSNISEKEIETKTDAEVKKCITTLKEKKKKFKNIIDKILYIKEDEINSIIDVLNRKEKFKNNESTINEDFLKTYVDARYYNISDEGNIDFNSKNKLSKINEQINIKAKKMISKYNGSDAVYEDKVNKFNKFYVLVNNLEILNKTNKNIDSKRESYKNKILPVLRDELTSSLELMDIVNKIIIIQKVHDRIIKETLENLNSNMFELILEKISNNQFAVNLKHNINFSKVYSDYIVDKTYSEGIIAEDKTMIMITMVVQKIVEDMLDGDFDNKYYIHIPSTVYEKRNKLEKIFGLFDDNRGKESIVVVNDYNEVIKNKKTIKQLRKDGYHFAISFNTDAKIKESDIKNIALADYIFTDSKTLRELNLIKIIPEELKDKIIDEDAHLRIID